MVVTLFAVHSHDANREIVVDDLVGVEGRAQVVLVTYGDGQGLGIFIKICQHGRVANRATW